MEQPLIPREKITYVIKTPKNENNKFVIPEDPEIPRRFWGMEMDNHVITWWEEPKQRIFLTVLGDPTAQKRHRSTAYEADGRTRIRNYDGSSGDKADFLSMIQANAPEKPFDTPLRVDCTFYFPRLKSHYGTGKNEGVLKANAPICHTPKPDRDNLDKFVLDSMKGVFWRDDSIACIGEIKKLYSERPRTEILITVL